ncbi:bifunctional (p)ppGpp synthetase/guanosine-3',5'-bis(diphosphate) 3'-pyrophosphohydrolase [Acidaminobacter sp. JC074]|uniref:HD domain-containing protein n=1 Tax=Acidaminobacter sp. JC074 TaxID=2530199 RepID=UPI001F0F6144|nr:HD domain-containing protein [Acidaminobacter sp. JC074]MCH4887586.1 bifunctional (p)ppGpp synthetase/guanosine-3',5'-bis(diphosphate) 3'-pyrophosphohydrolase [Acidaminobacter sp. JC074]
MILSNNVQKALNDTLVYHRHQKRKGTDIPYAAHPISLAVLLIDGKFSEEMVIAALLHDTIEDTSMTEAELKERYGQRVYDLVMACTEKDQSQPWEERKRHTIEKFHRLDEEAKWILLVDKLHNIYSMTEQYKLVGDRLWQFFSRGYDKQKWYYGELLKTFSQHKPFHNHDLLKRYEEFYLELFEE